MKIIILNAFRNLLRQKSRTGLSLLMIVSAFCALTLFRAFIDDTLGSLETVSTEMQYGHYQIALKKYWANTQSPRKNLLLFNSSSLIEAIAKNPEVKSVTGRLQSFGLISTGEKTEAATLLGIDVKNEAGLQKTIIMQQGNFLSATDPKQVIVGHLLAHRIGVKIGDQLTMLANTIDNVVNAYDLTVVGFFAAGTEEVDKYFVYLPLQTLQEIIQTDGVDLLSIKIKDRDQLQNVKASLSEDLKKINSEIELRDWMELSDLFRKVVKFYNSQNMIIEGILLFIVILGILNTVGMSVNERIGEIGTLRALGESRLRLMTSFITESFLLSLIGAFVGTLVSLAIGHFLNYLHIETEFPGASTPVPILFHFTPPLFIKSLVFIVISSLVATLIPAYRGVSANIVDALRRNI